MGVDSKIEWTHHTFNPWWGCVRVSPGCENCYAESFDHRLGGGHWGRLAPRRFFGLKHWQQPRRWNRLAAEAGERHRVFCASMADALEVLPAEHPSASLMAEARGQLWDLILDTPELDWLLLTKRPQNAPSVFPDAWRSQLPPNVWFGVTMEDQRRAEERLPHLMAVNASIRFVSYEPALGPIDLLGTHTLGSVVDYGDHPDGSPVLEGEATLAEIALATRTRLGIDWVIAGAESGHGARPAADDWFRYMRDQCGLAGAAFFLKQKAAGGVKISTPELDGERWTEIPDPGFASATSAPLLA